MLSVPGNLNDFTKVGKAANPSAVIEKIIAKLGFFVINHKITPMIAIAPQTKSKRLSSQYAFLFNREATKTMNGPNPDVKVRIEVRPTPCLI